MSGVAALEYSVGFVMAMGGVGFMALEGMAGQFSESTAEIGGAAFLAGAVLMGHAESWM